MNGKRLIAGMCGVLLFTTLTGCSKMGEIAGNAVIKGIGNSDTITEGVDKPYTNIPNVSSNKKSSTNFTERQLDILYAQGLSDSEIEDMEKRGMSYKQERLLEVAETLLDALNEKYGETFFMEAAALKGLTVGEDYIMAVSQYHTDEPFKAELVNGECYDEYYGILIRLQIERYISNLLYPVLGSCSLDVGISGTFGPEFDAYTTIDETMELIKGGKSSLELSGNIYIPSSGGTRSEFTSLAESVKETLEENSLAGKITLYEMDQSFIAGEDVESLARQPSLWHEYIVIF